MQVHNLSDSNSILSKFLFELRSKTIQSDRRRFRHNIERIGEILAYEMSKTFSFSEEICTTPLGEKTIGLPKEKLVICSVLRAGLTLHHGVLNYLDEADSAFISAFRKHDKEDPSEFQIIVEYVACPDLNDKTLILIDPMLASGKSIHLTYESLLQYGIPSTIHVISVIGAKQGVDYVKSIFPENSHLWIADIDPALSDYAYIVPGLGDAGDLAYGEKLQH